MSDTCSSLLVHCVFSTKDRIRNIDADLQPKLWAYLGGIARQNDFKALAVGGVEDHVHALLSISPVIAVSKAVQLLKGGSSKWVHENHRRDFAWQAGYGAFTIGISQVEDTIKYIANQQEHHKRRDYRAEFEFFLQRHGMDASAFSRPSGT